MPLAAALAGAAAVVGGSYGLLRAALPRATTGEHLALRTLGRLDTWRSFGALVRLQGRTVAATCTQHRARTVITYEDGARILVRGRYVHQLAPSGPAHARLLAERTVEPRVEPELLVAEAVLGGSRSLYVAGLGVALARGRNPYVGDTRVDGTRAHVFLLEQRPRVELLVSARTLEPLAVRYASAHVRGSSRLDSDRGGRRLASVGGAGC